MRYSFPAGTVYICYEEDRHRLVVWNQDMAWAKTVYHDAGTKDALNQYLEKHRDRLSPGDLILLVYKRYTRIWKVTEAGLKEIIGSWDKTAEVNAFHVIYVLGQ